MQGCSQLVEAWIEKEEMEGIECTIDGVLVEAMVK